MGEISYGSYTNIHKENDYLIKEISFKNLDANQLKILQDTQKSITDIEEYQTILKKYKFPFEPIKSFIYEEDRIICKQKYIESENIDQILQKLYNSNNLKSILKIFEDVVNLWVKSHKSEEYFVDYNLRNFVYKNGKLILIDLFPPLIAKNISKPSCSASKSQIALWCNSYVNLASLFCYFVQDLVCKKNKNNFLQLTINGMFEIINKKLKITKEDFIDSVRKIDHVFAKRFLDLMEIYDNKYKIDDFLNVSLY